MLPILLVYSNQLRRCSHYLKMLWMVFSKYVNAYGLKCCKATSIEDSVTIFLLVDIDVNWHLSWHFSSIQVDFWS